MVQSRGDGRPDKTKKEEETTALAPQGPASKGVAPTLGPKVQICSCVCVCAYIYIYVLYIYIYIYMYLHYISKTYYGDTWRPTQGSDFVEGVIADNQQSQILPRNTAKKRRPKLCAGHMVTTLLASILGQILRLCNQMPWSTLLRD